MDLPWRIGYLKREDGVVISTVKPPCLAWYGTYETAIRMEDELSWKIYKGYENKEDALIGHKEFCEMSKEEILNLSPIG